MTRPLGLSGYIPIRNGVEHDYCFVESIISLLPICDEVVICDSDSTDTTRSVIDSMVECYSKVRVINYPYKEAVGDQEWYDRWLNFAREHLRFSAQLQFDADEILDPFGSYAVREAALEGECRRMKYVHFWRDAHHTTQWGHGHSTRTAPTECYMPSHGKLPDGVVNIRLEAETKPMVGTILHYSMLRRREAFFKKQRFLLRTLEGTTDEVLERAEQDGQDYMTYRHDKIIDRFNGEHPAVIRPWLQQRGWL